MQSVRDHGIMALLHYDTIAFWHYQTSSAKKAGEQQSCMVEVGCHVKSSTMQWANFYRAHTMGGNCSCSGWRRHRRIRPPPTHQYTIISQCMHIHCTTQVLPYS